MIALLLDTDESQKHNLTDPSTSLGLARYPYLITNDRLHDHSSKLRNTSLFRRLYQCHSVRYRFNQFSNEEGCIEVQFLPADLFHPKIQVNMCTSTRISSQPNNSFAGKVWHFPVKTWPANERFVIRLPENTELL